MGSDITADRTRFDFTFGRKVTKEELATIEEIVNEKLRADLPVQYVEMPKEEAKNMSVQDLFGTDKKGGEGQADELSLQELEDIDELKDLGNELNEIHDDTRVTKEIETSKNKCPNCGTKTTELVFCPNCGAAFCNHCAKKVDVQKEFIGYACPKCANAFKLKK